jgi:hypothetical protein
LRFDIPQQAEDPTGISLKQKNIIYELLIDIGIPLTSDGKNDYAFLVKKVVEQSNDGEKLPIESK